MPRPSPLRTIHHASRTSGTADPRRARRGGRRLHFDRLEGRTLLSAAGSLDPTFGGAGTVATKVGSDYVTAGSATGVAIQADGKTVEVGSKAVQEKNGTWHMDLAVLRYNVNGTLDSSFGVGGEVDIAAHADNWNTHPHLFSVKIQPWDQRIVVSGSTRVTYGKGSSAVSRDDLLVARLNVNGSMDRTFNGTGQSTLDLAQGNLFACGVAVQPDGSIVAAASPDVATNTPFSTGGIGFVVARWTAAGKPDTSFGPGGQGYVARPNGQASTMIVDPSGNILVGGRDADPVTGAGALAVVRYTGGGLADTTFGTDGEVRLPGAYGVAGIGVQSNGAIVLSGAFDAASTTTVVNGVPSTTYNLGLARLTPSGSLDVAFGSGGYFADATAGPSDADLVVQANDMILVAGASASAPTAFALDRVLADGSGRDTSFGNAGQAVASFGGAYYNAIPNAIAIGPDGNITVAGQLAMSHSYSLPYAKRYGTARFRGA